MKTQLGNIEFLFNCSKKGRLQEAMLYYRLRLHAHNRGGYVTDFDFTKNERYNLLPRLIRYGWVADFSAGKQKVLKLNSHRKKVCKNLNTHYNVEYSEKEVSNIKIFRAWVVSLAEEYSLTKNYKKQQGKNKWYSHRDREWVEQQFNGELANKHKIAKLKKENHQILSGRVSNSFVSNLLGVSERTVTSWRSAPFSWKTRKGDKGWYKVLDGFCCYFLRDCFGDSFDESVYFNGHGMPIRKDMKIHVQSRLFTHKHSRGAFGFS